MKDTKVVDFYNLFEQELYMNLIKNYKDYYTNKILNNDSYKNAINFYKGNGYHDINTILYATYIVNINFNKFLTSIKKIGINKFLKVFQSKVYDIDDYDYSDDDEDLYEYPTKNKKTNNKEKEKNKIIYNLYEYPTKNKKTNNKEKEKNKIIYNSFIDDLIKNNTNLFKNFVLNLNRISIIDDVIYNAPLLNKNIILYRGMEDITNNFKKCENGFLEYTFPNYLSVSLDPNVALGFMYNKNAALYKLIIPKNTRLLPIFAGTKNEKKWNNIRYDYEIEFLLLRKSKFRLLNSEFISPAKYDINQFRIADEKCLKNKLYKIRLYTIELVSQPSLEDLVKDYEKLKNNIKIDILSPNLNRDFKIPDKFFNDNTTDDKVKKTN